MKTVFSFVGAMMVLGVSYAQNVSDFYKDQIRLTYELVEQEVLSEVQAEEILDEIKASAKTEMRMLAQGESLEGEKHVVVFYSKVMENGFRLKDLSLERDTAFAEEIAERIQTMKASYVSGKASSKRDVYIGGIVVGRIFGERTEPNGASASINAIGNSPPSRIRLRVSAEGMFGSRVFDATINGSLEEAYKVMKDAEKRMAKELGSFSLEIESKMHVVYEDGSTEQMVFKSDSGEDIPIHELSRRGSDTNKTTFEFTLGSGFDKENRKKVVSMPIMGVGLSQFTKTDLSGFYNADDNYFFNWNFNFGVRLEYAPVKWFYIPLEARFDFVRFRQKNNTFFEWTQDGTEQVEFGDDLQRSSWGMNHTMLQLGFGFDFGKDVFFKRLELGAYGGYHLRSSTRIRYGDTFTTVKERTQGHFNQEPFRYGFYLSFYNDRNIQNRFSVDRSSVLRDGLGDSFTMVSYTLNFLLF
jgi:hypothetical protein